MNTTIKETIEKIENKIELLTTLKTVRGKLMTVTMAEDTLYVAYNLGVIGCFQYDDKLTNEFLERNDYGIDTASIFNIAYFDETMMDEDNWCFDEDNFLEEYVERIKLNKINKNYLLQNGYSEEELHGVETPPRSWRSLHMVEELIKMKIEVHEEVPVTNSISLANEFDLKTKHIIESLTETINLYPLLIKDTTIGFHRTDETNFNKHINVPEPLYEKFLKKIPSSTDRVMEFKRDKATSEYYEAFKKLRNWVYSEYNDSDLLKNILSDRKKITKSLIVKISSLMTDDVEPDLKSSLYRHMFMHINYACGINSLKQSNMNRNNLDENIQANLKWLESVVTKNLNNIASLSIDTIHMFAVLNFYIESFNDSLKLKESFNTWTVRNVDIINEDKFNMRAFKNPYNKQ